MATVTVKVIAHAFDSDNAIQYFPGDVVQLDLANPFERKLVSLRTPRGKWVVDFDRANSSDPAIHMFFCKQCGEPFERLNELGTHDRQYHNKTKVAAALAKQDADDEEDDALMELVMAQPMIVEPQVDEVDVKDQQKAKLIAAIKAQSKGQR